MSVRRYSAWTEKAGWELGHVDIYDYYFDFTDNPVNGWKG